MTSIVQTPWGTAHSSTEIAPGIIRYDTASHGGYWLSPKRVAEMPKPLQNFVPFSEEHCGPGRWYEEDADWAVVALAFPQYFPEDAIPAALATLRNYKPELFAEVVALFEQQGKHVYSIHYADREMAREHDDPTLGIIVAGTKDEAETLAGRGRDVLRRAVPCASLWAVEIKPQAEEKAR